MVYQKEHRSLTPRQILGEETRCIEDHAPGCQACCPLHLNVRSLNAFIREGDWQSALEVMEKATYFPRILAMSCGQSCQTGCKRQSIGGALNRNELERTVIRNAKPVVRQIDPYVKLSLTVAVIGGGVAGLTAAAYLAEKGFRVSVFEKMDALGGRARFLPGMTQEMLDRDFKFLKDSIFLYFKTDIGKEVAFQYLVNTYDGMLITGADHLSGSGLELDSEGHPVYDPETWQSSDPKIFVAGSAIHREQSLEEAMAEGKRAAISLDRFLKNVSLTANRTNEGVYQTKLVVNTAKEQPIPQVLPQNPSGYTAEEAKREASRCLDCHCNECVHGCVMLEKYGKKPRQYIREIANNLIIALGRRTSNHFINACTFCGLCGQVCPNALDMGDICLSAREDMVKTNKMPPAIHDFPIRDMLFSNSGEFSLCLHAPGTGESKYLFFPGCQQAALAPRYIRPVYDYLREHMPGNVGLFLGCCGAPAHWGGRRELFEETIQGLKENWQAMGKPIVITGCTTCFQELKEVEGMELVTLWQCIDKYGLPREAVKSTHTEPVAVHDPCTSRYEPEIYESVRHILKKLDCPVEELFYSKDKTCCCGYGGLAIYGNPEITEAMLENRVSQSPRDYLTYCWVCRDYFNTKGEKQTLHLMDLLFNQGEVSPHYDISEKRFNRRRLKEELLAELWQEKTPPQAREVPDVLGKKLLISPELRDRLADRLILTEDVAGTIAYAEKTGNKVLRPADHHFFAHYQPGIITYWVEYTMEEDRYVLHNAYSHRLELLDGQKEEDDNERG